jgi:outer membrane receptor protein involved in Fe transport
MKSKLQHQLSFLIVLFLLNSFNVIAQDGFIKGRITDESGDLPGVNVFVEGPASTIVLSDIDGTFSAKVPAGEYEVSVDVMGYGIQKKKAVVRAGQVAVVDFNLSFSTGGVTSSATLFEQSTLDAPATVYVFSQSEIRNNGYQNIQELLEDVPEVEIQKKSMVEFKDNIGFRGITGNEKFIIFQNGVRISAATGDPHTVHTNYPLNNVKRVEVLVGPASAVYGADAFSGLINIITEDGEEVNGGRLMGSYGLYNTLDNSFVVGQKVKDLKITASGNFYNSDEPDFNNIYSEEFSWFNDQYATNGNVLADPFFPDTISVGTNSSRNFEMPMSSYNVNFVVDCYDFQMGYARRSEMHSSSLPARPQFSIYDEVASYGFTIETMYGKYNYESEDEKLRLQTLITYNTMENNVNSLFVNTYTGYNQGYKYQYGKTLRFEQLGTYVFNEDFNFAMGMSVEDVSALPKTGDLPTAFDRQTTPEFQDLYYFGTNIMDKDSNDLTLQQDFYYLQYKNLGGFMQFQYAPSEKINITAGMRYDYNTRYGQSINPRLAILVKPNEALRVKLLYNEAFLSPSPWKAYQHYGSFVPTTDAQGEVTGLQSFFFHLPNPDLKPEKLRSFEGSVSYTLTDWSFGLNGYYNRVTDVINYFGADFSRNSFKGYPVAFVETPLNEGTLETYGGTFKVNYRKDLDLASNAKLSAYIYYTFMDGLLDNKKLPYTAQNTLRIGGSFSNDRFVVSPRLIYRTASYSILEDDNGDLIKNSAYALLNIHAGYHILNTEKNKLTFFVDVSNALNSKYYAVSNIGVEGFPLAPQDPLRARIGLDFNF